MKRRRIVVVRYRRITVMLDRETRTDVDLDSSEVNNECCEAPDCSQKRNGQQIKATLSDGSMHTAFTELK